MQTQFTGDGSESYPDGPPFGGHYAYHAHGRGWHGPRFFPPFFIIPALFMMLIVFKTGLWVPLLVGGAIFWFMRAGQHHHHRAWGRGFGPRGPWHRGAPFMGPREGWGEGHHPFRGHHGGWGARPFEGEHGEKPKRGEDSEKPKRRDDGFV